MDVVRDVVLVLATVSTGLMAGVFFAYAISLMPGLARSDDRTFVTAFQNVDRAIVNPLFLSIFLGTLVINVVAGVVHIGGDGRSALPWIVAAAVLYLVVVAITVRVHVPLNNAIKAAGDPDRIDVAATRVRFTEGRWIGWNAVRTVLSVAAFGCLAVALVVG
ncbi:MAG TPA: anthrone oxygenase family protein [Jiangellaceae bacterium]